MQPPAAKTIPHAITSHAETRTDEYFWLRDRDNPETIAYLEAENQFTDAVMEPTKDLQEKLYAEIVGRVKETDLSVPVRKGSHFYYTRTEEGKEYPIYCRKRGSLEAEEEVLLDGNVLAEGKEYFRLGNFAVSPGQELLAYSTENAGDETYTLVVKDLRTGELLPEQIPNTYYGLAWANDDRTIFYTTLDETKRPYRLHRHTLGTLVEEDALIYEETDQKFVLQIGKTRSERYLMLTLASHVTSEILYASADEAASEFRTIGGRQHEVEYYADHQGEHFYIRTNEQAKNFRLMRAPVSAPEKTNWQEVLAHRPAVLLEDVEPFAHHLVLQEREEGLTKLRVMDLRNGQDHYIAFPEPVYTAGLGANPEYETTTIRYHYTSLVTPNSVFDYDMNTRAQELKKQTEVVGGYDSSQYVSERIWATAPDGVRVPISLVYRKGLEKDGSHPAFLYGYGSYGHAIEPQFSSARLSLLDRGFVYAIAHIRGGSELGKAWHDEGKLLKKKNTFSDFIACAEKLIADGYTAAGKLAIYGGSAGGLLMGAVLNERPDLFGAAIAAVPFVDVLNTMEDATLPLTVGEYEEWGNPADPQYFEYIRSYSPYDNVGPKPYPHLLVRAGLNDPRVSYWEPAKWTAKLRKAWPSGRKLLLKTEMGAGHGGPSGRYEAFRETAFDYAFLLMALEMGNR